MDSGNQGGPGNHPHKSGGAGGAPAYGVPFMNIMPQNLIEPTYGSQIYNPQVGAQLGSGVNPFSGPGGTLSGRFGQFIQPGFPIPGSGQTGTPPGGPSPFPPMGGQSAGVPTVPPGVQPPPQRSVSSGPVPPGIVNGQVGSQPGTQPGLFQWANTPYAAFNPGRR